MVKEFGNENRLVRGIKIFGKEISTAVANFNVSTRTFLY